MHTRTQINAQWGYQISRYWQRMTSHYSSMEKLCQCHGRKCRHAYRTNGVKSLNSFERIQPRMMVATFNGNPRATIISCNSPTNISEKNEQVAFYDELSSLVRSIPKHNMLVIGGDTNAQIGKNRNNKYNLHNTSNRNGQHLTDFRRENRLTCLNTNYQKREGKLWTYTYANNNNKAQIDYVFINKKWKNRAMNCEAYSSFKGVSSDHRIVTAKIRLSLRKNATRTATTKHYDCALLNNRDIRDNYVLELRNRFETLQEKTEKVSKWRIWEFRQRAPRGSSELYSNKSRTKYRVPWKALAVREKCADVKTACKSYRKNPTNTNALKLKKGTKGISKHISKRTDSTFTRWRLRILRHCSRSTTRGYACPIPLYHLSRLRA